MTWEQILKVSDNTLILNHIRSKFNQMSFSVKSYDPNIAPGGTLRNVGRPFKHHYIFQIRDEAYNTPNVPIDSRFTIEDEESITLIITQMNEDDYIGAIGYSNKRPFSEHKGTTQQTINWISSIYEKHFSKSAYYRSWGNKT